jgi:DHA2 family multidrug resistance protein
LFKSFNFAAANVTMFVFGALLFGALVTMPQFLQTVLGYTAENAGLVLSGGGLAVLLLVPIVGALAGRYPAKCIIAMGRLAPAIGMYGSTVQLDTLISFQSATVLRVIQSVRLGLLFVPVTMAGYIGIPAEKVNSVAGIINFMRNIGSSMGTSMVTVLARHAQAHRVVLSRHTTRFDPSLQNQVKALSLRLVHSGASVADAPRLAYGLLCRFVGGQAETLAYIIVRKNDPKAAGGMAAG